MAAPTNTESYTGRYTRAFLNELVGEDNYTVRSFQLNDLSDNEVYEKALDAIHDEDLSFGYMSDTKLTLVWLHDYPGWLQFCEPLGISIRPSPKIAKRLTVMTRLTYLYAMKQPDELKIVSCSPQEFSRYNVDPELSVRFLDGANVISLELLEEMITNGSSTIEANFTSLGKGNPWEKDLINRAIDNAGSFSLRVTTPDGLIKGDAIAVPRARIPDEADILYCEENIKDELITRDFVFVLAEPHPGVRRHEFSRNEPAPPAVWTDDQSMSWLGEWLYPREQLVSCLKDFAETVYQELYNGEFPSFFTDVAKRDDKYSTITQFQVQALEWEAEGLGLQQSIFLQERIGQGAINQLSKKRRWPVPCAMYVHVATDSWLHMAGYFDPDEDEHPWPFQEPETPRGMVWYHPQTGRLVYNDLDFAELYDRHGGWDLDDSVKAHARTMNGRRVWVIVRSPNSMGEYDVKGYVEGTFAPVWTFTDGTQLSFPEINEQTIPYIEDLDITYSHSSLAPQRERREIYTKQILEESLDMAISFRGVFGRRANADIAYFGIMHDYRREQLAPIEAIVDACTQEQSEWALQLIQSDTESIINELRRADVTADRILWHQRIKRFYPEMSYAHLEWSQLAVVHDTLCELYQKKLFELAQQTAEAIDPDVLDLGLLYASQGEQLVRWYYRLMRELPFDPEEETRTEFCHRVNDVMCARLQMLPKHVAYNNILAMARYCYTTKHGSEYKDTPIFQAGVPGRPSIFQYYLDAISFYGIGQQNWQVSIDCVDCESKHLLEDRVEYQLHLMGKYACRKG